jgi:hypothetical protein
MQQRQVVTLDSSKDRLESRGARLGVVNRVLTTIPSRYTCWYIRKCPKITARNRVAHLSLVLEFQSTFLPYHSVYTWDVSLVANLFLHLVETFLSQA